MQTLDQGFEEGSFAAVEDLTQNWRSQLKSECAEQSAATRESIVRWLLGDNLEQFKRFNPVQLKITQEAISYRYRILRHRYLGLGPQGYRHLMQRLGSLVLLRNKIPTSAVVDVLQAVIQELLQSDRYMQQQIAWIAQCTAETELRNALLFTSTEEYCLRPIRNQPLLIYRFVNYLRRCYQGDLTQVPVGNSIRLVASQILAKDSKQTTDLNNQVEQQMLRTVVKQEFERYLAEHVGAVAVQWLRLYLQGRSQEEIAHKLNLQVQEANRLREKISYHAVRLFTIANNERLVISKPFAKMDFISEIATDRGDFCA